MSECTRECCRVGLVRAAVGERGRAESYERGREGEEEEEGAGNMVSWRSRAGWGLVQVLCEAAGALARLAARGARWACERGDDGGWVTSTRQGEGKGGAHWVYEWL